MCDVCEVAKVAQANVGFLAMFWNMACGFIGAFKCQLSHWVKSLTGHASKTMNASVASSRSVLTFTTHDEPS